MEVFFRTHTYLIEHLKDKLHRGLMDEIDWSARLIGIKGTRSVGKTTFLLQYAKKTFGAESNKCLYINMNNFYFQNRSIVHFAEEFVANGGRVLLIDQIYKQPDWVEELKICYERFPQLNVVFTVSSVMRLKDEDFPLRNIVKSYNLRGFSFREYLNFKIGSDFKAYTLKEILDNHETITREIIKKISPTKYFEDYLHHGFYPFFTEGGYFTESLLKSMNMMTEVDILLLKKIELKYLSKIKRLFYLLALGERKAPNVSALANELQTSRATVMNYIKYLADARLLNIIYDEGDDFPKKPSRVILHNSNLVYAVLPETASRQSIMESFFVNALWKDHKVNQSKKTKSYIVDESLKFRVCDAQGGKKMRTNQDTIYAYYNTDIGLGNRIPLWLLGFLY